MQLTVLTDILKGSKAVVQIDRRDLFNKGTSIQYLDRKNFMDCPTFLVPDQYVPLFLKFIYHPYDAEAPTWFTEVQQYITNENGEYDFDIHER